MAKQFANAAPLCDEILRLEPGNDTARQFRPLIAEAQSALSPEHERVDARCVCVRARACVCVYVYAHATAMPLR